MNSPEREGRAVRWAILLAAVAVAVVLLLGRGREVFQPEPEAAWVAVQAAGSDVAVVGTIELAAGQAFDLHAVVEARKRNGEKIYYTEAKRVEIAGRELAADSLRRWGDGAETRVLWFTVEAFPPYLEESKPGSEKELGYRAVYQADWPFSWKVPGTVEPSVENYLPDRPTETRALRFGTQRFRVRVEIRGDDSAILPRRLLESWGPEELVERGASFPGVVATLPGSLAEPSSVFGLPQRELRPEAGSERLRLLSEWHGRRLAFSRLTLLKAWLDSAGLAWEDLAWRTADLEARSSRFRPGDLVRAGERLVWILEDRGRQGVLDGEDLCLDFVRGARVSTLREIFTGSGLVELAAAEQAEGR